MVLQVLQRSRIRRFPVGVAISFLGMVQYDVHMQESPPQFQLPTGQPQLATC